MILDTTTSICLSGGATGADLQWGMTAGTAGHKVVHFSFRGHRTSAPPSEVVVLSDQQLREADDACLQASASLKRRFLPASTHPQLDYRGSAIRNLLRRNYFQVAWADACYGVAKLKDGHVAGGTAWAIQMFMDRFDGRDCPAYLFDQHEGRWLQWNGGQWVPIYEPPMPTGVWAGVGSRELHMIGKLAIRVLMRFGVNASPSSEAISLAPRSDLHLAAA